MKHHRPLRPTVRVILEMPIVYSEFQGHPVLSTPLGYRIADSKHVINIASASAILSLAFSMTLSVQNKNYNDLDMPKFCEYDSSNPALLWFVGSCLMLLWICLHKMHSALCWRVVKYSFEFWILVFNVLRRTCAEMMKTWDCRVDTMQMVCFFLVSLFSGVLIVVILIQTDTAIAFHRVSDNYGKRDISKALRNIRVLGCMLFLGLFMRFIQVSFAWDDSEAYFEMKHELFGLWPVAMSYKQHFLEAILSTLLMISYFLYNNLRICRGVYGKETSKSKNHRSRCTFIRGQRRCVVEIETTQHEQQPQAELQLNESTERQPGAVEGVDSPIITSDTESDHNNLNKNQKTSETVTGNNYINNKGSTSIAVTGTAEIQTVTTTPQLQIQNFVTAPLSASSSMANLRSTEIMSPAENDEVVNPFNHEENLRLSQTQNQTGSHGSNMMIDNKNSALLLTTTNNNNPFNIENRNSASFLTASPKVSVAMTAMTGTGGAFGGRVSATGVSIPLTAVTQSDEVPNVNSSPGSPNTTVNNFNKSQGAKLNASKKKSQNNTKNSSTRANNNINSSGWHIRKVGPKSQTEVGTNENQHRPGPGSEFTGPIPSTANSLALSTRSSAHLQLASLPLTSAHSIAATNADSVAHCQSTAFSTTANGTTSMAVSNKLNSGDHNDDLNIHNSPMMNPSYASDNHVNTNKNPNSINNNNKDKSIKDKTSTLINCLLTASDPVIDITSTPFLTSHLGVYILKNGWFWHVVWTCISILLVNFMIGKEDNCDSTGNLSDMDFHSCKSMRNRLPETCWRRNKMRTHVSNCLAMVVAIWLSLHFYHKTLLLRAIRSFEAFLLYIPMLRVIGADNMHSKRCELPFPHEVASYFIMILYTQAILFACMSGDCILPGQVARLAYGKKFFFGKKNTGLQLGNITVVGQTVRKSMSRMATRSRISKVFSSNRKSGVINQDHQNRTDSQTVTRESINKTSKGSRVILKSESSQNSLRSTNNRELVSDTNATLAGSDSFESDYDDHYYGSDGNEQVRIDKEDIDIVEQVLHLDGDKSFNDINKIEAAKLKLAQGRNSGGPGNTLATPKNFWFNNNINIQNKTSTLQRDLSTGKFSVFSKHSKTSSGYQENMGPRFLIKVKVSSIGTQQSSSSSPGRGEAGPKTRAFKDETVDSIRTEIAGMSVRSGHSNLNLGQGGPGVNHVPQVTSNLNLNLPGPSPQAFTLSPSNNQLQVESSQQNPLTLTASNINQNTNKTKILNEASADSHVTVSSIGTTESELLHGDIPGVTKSFFNHGPGRAQSVIITPVKKVNTGTNFVSRKINSLVNSKRKSNNCKESGPTQSYYTSPGASTIFGNLFGTKSAGLNSQSKVLNNKSSGSSGTHRNKPRHARSRFVIILSLSMSILYLTRVWASWPWDRFDDNQTYKHNYASYFWPVKAGIKQHFLSGLCYLITMQAYVLYQVAITQSLVFLRGHYGVFEEARNNFDID